MRESRLEFFEDLLPYSRSTLQEYVDGKEQEGSSCSYLAGFALLFAFPLGAGHVCCEGSGGLISILSCAGLNCLGSMRGFGSCMSKHCRLSKS